MLRTTSEDDPSKFSFSTKNSYKVLEKNVRRESVDGSLAASNRKSCCRRFFGLVALFGFLAFWCKLSMEWFGPGRLRGLRVPEDCKFWFDGCNNCARVSFGAPLVCTEMSCKQNEEPACHERFHETDDYTESTKSAPAKCQEWFDGCNTCSRSEPGNELSCTRMICDRTETPKCLHFFEKKTAEMAQMDETSVEESIVESTPPNCQEWFDGCNMCTRSLPSGDLACTRMFCDRLDTPRCEHYFPDETAVEVPAVAKVSRGTASAAPDECKVWFDGCNKCRRGSVGAPLACTRMYCPRGMTRDPKCLEMFD
mmetsp:Transcript_14777/g.20974  ORF Transcript_14777/g.20974 Transcript_14777/m.20974 type:complete len:310 (+) Transcript_14777:107-1036(+)